MTTPDVSGDKAARGAGATQGSTRRSRSTGWLLLLNLFVMALVPASVWLPVVLIYKHWPATVSAETVQASRAHPAAAAEKIADSVMTGAPLTGGLEPRKTVAAAEAALGGRIAIEGYPDFPFRGPFDRDLLEAGNSTWQLAYCGFVMPQLFLNAYQETGEAKFLEAAKDFILEWWSFERSLWSPVGFVWNDHAVASRAFVLARFWHHYRHHEIFEPAEAQKVLQLVRATARLLAEERLYTYRTNHGTMQDIALAKLARFFPLLESLEGYGRLALSRSAAQMASLINAEGVVREHSVGYHVFGLGLLSDLLALSELDDGREEEQFRSLLERGQDFLRIVRRPDGSLPRVGDTVRLGPVDSSKINLSRAGSRQNNLAGESHFAAVYPQSGYAVHRSIGEASSSGTPQGAHLLAYWGHTPYLGHKHADELSLHLWIDGVDWWTAVGYWPYFRDDRDLAISWRGANGPHLSEEALVRDRRARLKAQAGEGAAFFLDLVRDGPSGFVVRRQILAAPGNLWIVLDTFSDAQPRSAEVVWTSDSTNEMSILEEGHYILSSKDAPGRLAVRFLGSDAPRSESLIGEEGSPTGWVVRERETVRPAPAIRLQQSSQGSWLAKISAYEPAGRSRWSGEPRMTSWRSAEDWRLEVPLDGIRVTVERSQNRVALDYGPSAERLALDIRESPEGPQHDQKADAAYAELSARFGDSFRPLIDYRARVTWVALVLVAGHLLYLFLLLRYGGKAGIGAKLRSGGLCIPLAAWIGVAAWLHLAYFP